MTKEKKTILIGMSITILLLALAILIFYFIYNNSKENNNDNTNNNLINENINNNNEEIEKPVENNETSTPQENSSNQTEEETVSTPSEDEKIVTIYLFRGDGCPHCEHAMEFFKTLNTEYPYLRIISYEVWYNEENRKLMEEVSTELGIEVSTSVPLIIIGNDYNLRGYGEARNDEILEQVEKSYQSDTYEDIVEKVLENSSLNVTSEEII